jgi:hypothetical protein
VATLVNFMLVVIVAILAMSAVPVCAQEQRPNVEKLKADAQNVFKIISGDKLKIQTYCKIADLNGQLGHASREQDTKKIEELAEKIDVLESKLNIPLFVVPTISFQFVYGC